MPPSQTTATGLHLDSAGYAVAGKVILSGISLHLTEARIGIVGRNGSGKTTLLRLMAGLITPSTGSVRVAGADPTKDRRAMLARLGILFQNPDHQILFPTVEEELGFGLLQMGQSRSTAAAAVSDLLAREGRAHWAKAPVQTLSQGQRHYLCLLSVLLMEPQVILLDEPFAGLDLPTQARLARRVAGLGQQVIIVSHDPAAVSGVDRVIWVEGGQVKADGAAPAVLQAFVQEMARIGGQDADAALSC